MADDRSESQLQPALRVWRNDVTDWVIAESPEDATAIMHAEYGSTYDDEDEWRECPNDKPFTYHGDDGDITKTFGEWIAEKGRGFLATTEY